MALEIAPRPVIAARQEHHSEMPGICCRDRLVMQRPEVISSSSSLTAAARPDRRATLRAPWRRSARCARPSRRSPPDEHRSTTAACTERSGRSRWAAASARSPSLSRTVATISQTSPRPLAIRARRPPRPSTNARAGARPSATPPRRSAAPACGRAAALARRAIPIDRWSPGAVGGSGVAPCSATEHSGVRAATAGRRARSRRPARSRCRPRSAAQRSRSLRTRCRA